MTDPRVLEVQVWVNSTYKGVNGYQPAPENGKTGWSTVYALTRALQHELGITTLVDNFGEGTASRYRSFGELSSGFVAKTTQQQNILTILKGSMYCKGYDPGDLLGDTFTSYMKNSIVQLQTDAGLPVRDGKVYDYIFKAFLTMDAYRLVYGGDETTRKIQQDLNYNYYKTSGVQPTDGIYQRGTNRALIYGLQTEIGIAPESQTGAIGPATKAGLPTLREGQTSNFVKLYSYALYFNNYGTPTFSNYFTTALKNATMEFQRFTMLTVDGIVGKSTWLSALTSTGDPDRKGTACDCITTITPARAQALKAAGYNTIGRYLTNARTGTLDKKIKPGELQTIFDAGMRVFPIYQTYGGDAAYFNYGQGGRDAVAAITAAEGYGFKEGTTIYFAVDFDAYGFEIEDNILPHFSAIESEFYAAGGKYKVGVYGPRAVCSKVSESGYATNSFVSGMSTGFSGNLGYPLPKNWAFDQIATITVGSGDGSIVIDKNIASGRDAGQSSVNPVPQNDGLDYPLDLPYVSTIRAEVPPIIKEQLNFAQEFASIREPIDSVNIVLEYDGLITRMARKLQMRKSFIQTVIAWEASAENTLDGIQDKRVEAGDADDSSTGVGQIFAWVAIDARNWAVNQGYLDDELKDAENKEDVKQVWHKLHTDRAYNIETAAYVLKRGAIVDKGYPSNMLNYTTSQIKGTLERYNGFGDAAVEYGEQRYEIYQKFEKYNELSRLGN